jgi:hypothetical protein
MFLLGWPKRLPDTSNQYAEAVFQRVRTRVFSQSLDMGGDALYHYVRHSVIIRVPIKSLFALYAEPGMLITKTLF